MKNLFRFSGLALGAVCSTGFAEVTWEQQAERLQLVNAASIDAVPVGEPSFGNFALGGRAIISILPKIDPKVGAKSEKVPASPVHSVPTLTLDAYRPVGSKVRLGLSAWGGYLPKGSEKLLGIKASLVQYLYGASGGAEWDAGSVLVFGHLGYQYVNAKARGAITATDADDAFDSTTSLAFLAPGFTHKATGLWANVLLGFRTNKSGFVISESGTNLQLTDTLQDSAVAILSQFTVGWKHKSGVQLAFSEQWVPKRVLLPRVTLAYKYDLVGSTSSASQADALESLPNSKPTKSAIGAPKTPTNQKPTAGTPPSPGAPSNSKPPSAKPKAPSMPKAGS